MRRLFLRLVMSALLAVGVLAACGMEEDLSSDTNTEGSAGIDNITGTLEDWLRAVCKPGFYFDGLYDSKGQNVLNGADSGGYCSVTRGDDPSAVYVGQYPSDFLMENDLAAVPLGWYVSAPMGDGSLIMLASPQGEKGYAALVPLTQFGFSVKPNAPR
ncbi:hypothetical protein Q8814_17980 [Rhodococcus sp. CC-R104]|uniref:Lipoprotein n=1 Tax=Rhodococcus chondri TaxID=3065941 RepID=A0ABU7JVC4_9NOCA|nr:hypothetical protein [Rhodococcus sp. CC-R104]